MPKPSGIYMIANTATGACYVGSSVSFRSRKREHLSLLRNNKHHSPYMQRSYNIHGEVAFIWIVLEEVAPDRDLLFEREAYWIIILRPAYNASEVSASRLGTKLTHEQLERFRKTQTPEIRRRQIETRKLNNPSWHSIESRQKIKASRAKQETTPAMLEALKQGQEIRKQVNPRPRLGMKHAEATKQKMSEAALARAKPTKETIEKTRLANLGRKQSVEERQKRAESQRKRHAEHPMTEETKRKNSESNKGLKRSEEARENISKAHIGVKRSEESRRKQSETLKGTVFSEERRRNISEAKKAGWARKKAEQAKLKDATQLSP